MTSFWDLSAGDSAVDGPLELELEPALELVLMSWPVYSTRFAGPLKTGTAGTSPVYTVPSGKTAVVKYVTVANTHNTVGVSYRVSIVGNGTSQHVIRASIAPGTSLNLAVNLVLRAGESMYAWAPDVGNDCTFSAHGYLFNAV